jgi:outer membrane protein assembly factor BamB
MIITVIPKDGGSYRGRLACYSPSDLRNPIWNSAAEERFGLGPYLMIDGHLFVFKDDGELYVYKAGKGSMELLRSQRIMEGADAWGPMAYADGMLVLRDAHNVKCIRIR